MTTDTVVVCFRRKGFRLMVSELGKLWPSSSAHRGRDDSSIGPDPDRYQRSKSHFAIASERMCRIDKTVSGPYLASLPEPQPMPPSPIPCRRPEQIAVGVAKRFIPSHSPPSHDLSVLPLRHPRPLSVLPLSHLRTAHRIAPGMNRYPIFWRNAEGRNRDGRDDLHRRVRNRCPLGEHGPLSHGPGLGCP